MILVQPLKNDDTPNLEYGVGYKRVKLILWQVWDFIKRDFYIREWKRWVFLVFEILKEIFNCALEFYD